MNFRPYSFIVLLLSGYFSFGQILPEPGARLNYTQIMFEHVPITGADEYVVELAIYKHDGAFSHPIYRQKDSAVATMISNLEFGKKYLWRYTGLRNGKELGRSRTYDFEILPDLFVDKNQYRVRVLINDSLANEGGLIILDNQRFAVDRSGNFVWFFPRDTLPVRGDKRLPVPVHLVNDLRITPQGTVTLLNGANAQETDLTGHVLWQAPKLSTRATDSSKAGPPYIYNHCFKKLQNGHYMVINGISTSKQALLGAKTSDAKTGFVIGGGNLFVSDEVISEFDRQGNLVWHWSSINYFNDDEVKQMVQSKPDSALLDPSPGGHMNAFDADEKNGFVYAGFRNVDRVIKIDKKTSKVVCAWGKDMTYNGQKNADGFFCKQHETTLMRDGSIAVFNNDLRPEIHKGDSSVSSVVIFTQPTEGGNSRLAWKFDCRLDSGNNLSRRGGSVDELRSGNLLVCMGTVNKVFEITRKKQIVWSAVVEHSNHRDSTWSAYPLYKTHYTSSLYPCYFTIQTSADTLTKSSASFQLKIFNVGTEADSYNVSIASQSGRYKKQFSTEVLPGRKSLQFDIAPNKLPTPDDKIEVEVQSKTNPDFKRMAYLQYKK